MLYHCDRWYGNFTGRDTDAFYDERRDRRIWLTGNAFDASYYHADLQWHDQSDHACYAANHVEYAVKAETAKCGQALQDMISMIAWMELEISVFTLFLTISIYRGKDAGWASIILFVGALTVTIIYYIVAFQKHNNM